MIGARMLTARNSNFVAAVPSTAPAEEIAETVRLWQARYQAAIPVSPQPAPAPVVAQEPHLKEAAANWFAEARKQDQADQEEIRSRVNRLMGRSVLG